MTGPVHVAHWGTYVTTPQVSDDQATVVVKTQVSNRTGQEVKVTLRTTVRDSGDRTVSSKDVPAAVSASHGNCIHQPHCSASAAMEPGPSQPLYAGQRDHGQRQACGPLHHTVWGSHHRVRQGRGFLLNGQHVRLHGVCDHHDLGALGAAVNRRATERQLQILRPPA